MNDAPINGVTLNGASVVVLLPDDLFPATLDLTETARTLSLTETQRSCVVTETIRTLTFDEASS